MIVVNESAKVMEHFQKRVSRPLCFDTFLLTQKHSARTGIVHNFQGPGSILALPAEAFEAKGSELQILLKKTAFLV